MTSLEKKIGVRNALHRMCSYSDCDGCEFFNPDDESDGMYWCGIRDINGNVPSDEKWDMNTAMI